MSSSTPPLFCPPLQLRRLCCCPSCIDVPIFVLASITILLAAAVCVVPLMLLPMPPPPLIAFLVGTMRLPLRIPPMPPSPPHLRRVLRQVLRRVLRRFNQSASVFCRSNSYSRCCCRCHHRPHRSFTRLWPRLMLLLAPAAYDSTAITPSRFCFDEGLKRCLVPLRCSFCLPLCCHHCCVADVAASTAVWCIVQLCTIPLSLLAHVLGLVGSDGAPSPPHPPRTRVISPLPPPLPPPGPCRSAAVRVICRCRRCCSCRLIRNM